MIRQQQKLQERREGQKKTQQESAFLIKVPKSSYLCFTFVPLSVHLLSFMHLLMIPIHRKMLSQKNKMEIFNDGRGVSRSINVFSRMVFLETFRIIPSLSKRVLHIYYLHIVIEVSRKWLKILAVGSHQGGASEECQYLNQL